MGKGGDNKWVKNGEDIYKGEDANNIGTTEEYLYLTLAIKYLQQ